MKTFLRIACCLLSVNAYAQEIHFEWNKLLGISGKTSGLAISCDTSGFTYASGSFEGEITYSKTLLISEGKKDGYLFKLDPYGNLMWAKHFASSRDVKINDLKVDLNNDLIVLGEYRNNVTFDTTITSNNTDTIYSSNMFIAKYSPYGQMLWAENTGGITFDGNSVWIDSDNNILLTGKSIDISLFDETAPVTTLDSIQETGPDGNTYSSYFHPQQNYIVKMSSDGELMWIKETGGSPKEIISDHANNILITGNFTDDTTYFDETPVQAIGFETTFLAQYTSAGNLNWVKTSGGSANWNSGYGLEVDSDNNVYQSGQVLGNDVQFGGTVVSLFAGTDAFLSKYDVNGQLIWHRLIGTPTTMTGPDNFNSANALKMDKNGDLLLLGYFLDTLNFGPATLMSEGAFDLMLLKYNLDGEVLEAGQYTAYGWVNGLDLDVDPDNDIFLTGFTSLDQWNSLYPTYAFIGKINDSIPTFPLSVGENSALNNIVIFPNPSRGKIQLFLPDGYPKKKIELFAIDGRKIAERITTDSKISLEIKGAGLFIVRISFSDIVLTKKVIVE